MTNDPIQKEDYLEPDCLLCGEPFGQEPAFQPVPMDRVRQKLDELEGRQDFAGAERHLNYWLEEARLGRDRRGEFSLDNELMGFYRKQGRKDEAYRYAALAQALIVPLGIEGSVAAATCYVNSATVYDAFGEPERALEWFGRARDIYEKTLRPNDPLLGGLCNNMALALAATGRYDEAMALYERALDIMSTAPHGALEQAVTYMNMADAVHAQRGAEAGEELIGSYLDRAAALLDDPTLDRDGYYAFVCEKCAPGFDYYGWFAYAGELKERYEAIYAGT